MPKLKIIALIFVLLLIGSGWYIRQKQNIEVVNSPNLKTYRNEKFGFGFKYLDDPVNNLIVREDGPWSRHPITREEEICLFRNSIKFRQEVHGNTSVCMTIYNKDVDIDKVFPYQKIPYPETYIDFLSQKSIDIGGQEAVMIEWIDNRVGVKNFGLYVVHQDNIFVITSIKSTNHPLAEKKAKIDLDLFLKTFRFIK